MKLHHFGFLTNNTSECIKKYKILGFEHGDSFIDTLRGIKITFLSHNSTNVLFEIIEPMNEKSVVTSLMKKFQGNLYHSGYEVDDIKLYINELKSKKFIVIDQPKPAIAFENRNVAFLMSKNTGIIELIESGNE